MMMNKYIIHKKTDLWKIDLYKAVLTKIILVITIRFLFDLGRCLTLNALRSRKIWKIEQCCHNSFVSLL